MANGYDLGSENKFTELCRSFLTWFGHVFSAGQFFSVRSLRPYRDNDMIEMIL